MLLLTGGASSVRSVEVLVEQMEEAAEVRVGHSQEPGQSLGWVPEIPYGTEVHRVVSDDVRTVPCHLLVHG